MSDTHSDTYSDIYAEPMVNVEDAATYLAMPSSTLRQWRRDGSVHSVSPVHHGWPTLPFAAVVEAFVLRSLREVGFTRQKIRDAAKGIRREFNDQYGLVRPNIGHDGVDIFIEVGADLFRARDRQQVIRETVENFTKCIEWSGPDPKRLTLQHFGNVILDPRFGWGRPVVASNKVPLEAILGLWRAGEHLSAIAEEFAMAPADVEKLIQAWDRVRDTAA